MDKRNFHHRYSANNNGNGKREPKFLPFDRDQVLAALDDLRELYPRQSAKWRTFLLGERDFSGWEYWS